MLVHLVSGVFLIGFALLLGALTVMRSVCNSGICGPPSFDWYDAESFENLAHDRRQGAA